MKLFRNISFIFCFSIFFISCERSSEMIDDPGIPPAVPTGLSVYYASDGEITIDWRSNSEPGIKGYNIYRRTEFTEQTMIAFADENFFFDDSLEYDTTYFYKITAINLWDSESGFSNEIFATPVNRYNPLRPFGVEINAQNWEGDISVYLNWIDNDETDIAGYNIYRGTSPGFTADSTSLIGFTNRADFADTLNLEFYLNYYYKVKAKDKGGLLSNETDVVNDLILEIPEAIFPADNATVDFFNEFIISAIDVPATYRIGLQTNRFFDEIWSTTISSSIVNDTLKINFNPPVLQVNKVYYWRVSTYSGNSSDPNSISKLYSLTFRN